MDSLTDLKRQLIEHGFEIKGSNGHELIVGKDSWTLAHGVFYCNSIPVNVKQKTFIEVYKKTASKTKKWKGISGNTAVAPK